jgi:uncharacterized protein YodC (DUF2158 family)
MRSGLRSLQACVLLALSAFAATPSLAAASDFRAVTALLAPTAQRAGKAAHAAAKPPAARRTVPSNPAFSYFTLPPCRVFDSRLPADAPALQTGVARTIQVTGACGVPVSAKMVAVNATVTQPTADGSVELYPGDGTATGLQLNDFAAGQTRANNAVVQLALNGTGTLNALLSTTAGGQSVHFILDVTGYFADAMPVAVDDSYTTTLNTPLAQAAPGVLANDTLNGAAIVSYGATTGAEQTTIGAATPTSAGGSITLNADGSFNYTPPTGFKGDDTFKYVIQNAAGSSTATVTLSVGKGNQTITFTSTAPAGAKVGGPTYTVTATASSGLTVAFTIDASATSVCSISGSTVSFIGVGTCVIDANQAGDANYNPAPQVQQSFGVAKGDQTITFTSTAPAGAKVGGPTYTVTATASSGLAVAFTIDASASAVCTISGSTVSFIGVGTCVIDANQAGDANYNPAPQVQQMFAVGKGDQTITFTSTAPAGAKVGGPTYTVTATASSGLAVTFTIDASATSVCSISGSTVSFIGAGTCVIDANQAGNANYNAAPQAQQSFAVGKADQTITFTSTAPAGAKVGGPTYTVTATASSGLTVAFTIDASATSVCSISGSTVSFIGVGTCVIDANQAGDANYNAAPQVQQSFPVAKGDQTITFTSTAPAGAKVGGPTYTVTATASSGLAVTFTIDASASSVCTISGSTVSFIGVGTCVIDANQAGNANYNAAPQVQQSFPVAKGDQTITFTSPAPAGAKVGGPTYTVTATASSGLAVTFTIDASAASVCSISGSTVSFIGAGTCVIDANQAGNGNYNAAPQAQQSFPVAKGDQTISFTSPAPAGAKVGGPTYTVTATATSGLAVTFTIDASASAVCSISGSTVSFTAGGTCVIDANQAGNGNYNAAPQVQQSFPVAKADQTITFTSTPPTTAKIGDTYAVSATATSGLPVTFTIDASATSVCSVSGSTVSFNAGGNCVIDANQAGNASYNPAPQVQQSVYVNMPPQLVASPKENFDTVGNTQLQFAAVQSITTPAVFVVGNLVANFTDSDGPNPLSAIAIGAGATANGGTVSLTSTGEFIFTPKAGDVAASDSFQYQVTDGLYVVTRTVTINLKSRVWYVKNNAVAGGLGRSNDPFDTLAEAQTASLAGDYIFVYRGDGTTTGQAAGITLLANQKLYGEAYGLTVANTINGVANPTLVAANAANRPLIDNTAATSDGVTAANISGVEIRGLSIGATRHAVSVTTTGANSGGATITDNVVRQPGTDGIHVAAGGSGTMTMAVQSNSITGGTNGMNIQKTAGTLYITAFNDNTVTGTTPGSGIVVSGAIFDAVPGTPITTVSGGTTNVGVSGDGVGGSGMLLSGVTGDLSFNNLGIYNNAGTGLLVSSTGALNAGAGTGFRIAVGAGVGSIDSNGGPAVDVSNASLSLPLNFLRSLNSTTTGVSLVNAFGGVGGTAFSVSSGQITDPGGASGTAFNVNGGNGNVSLGVPIVNSSGNSVTVANRTSDTVSFSSTITDTGGGISLTSNTGATINFTGALSLTTGANTAFNATGGGTVTATDATSTATTTTGTAVNVANTTIGASGLKFKSVSAGTAASGPASGIVLNSTGASGGLTVAGGGGAGTGGTIQHTTGAGVSLTSTLSPSFTGLSINNTAGSGVQGTTVTNFTYVNGSVANSGTGGGAATSNIAFNTAVAGTETNVSGTVTITGNSLTNALWHGVDIENFNGTVSNANISSNTVTSSTSAASSNGSGIRLIAIGSTTTAGNVTTATIANNVISNFPSGSGIIAQGGNSNASGPSGTFGTPGTGNVIAITGNQIQGQSSANEMNGSAITATVSGKGQANFNISSNGTVANPLTNMLGTAIGCATNGDTTATFTVNNNVIVANNTVASNGIGGGTGVTFGTSDTPNMTWTITGNNISATDGNGILTVARGTTGTLHVKIQNNTVAAPLSGVREGIRIDAGNAASVNDSVCLNITGNTSAGSGGVQGIGLRKQGTVSTTNAFGVNGMAATSSPGVESYVNGLNPAGNGTLLLSATSGFSNCSLP